MNRRMKCGTFLAVVAVLAVGAVLVFGRSALPDEKQDNDVGVMWTPESLTATVTPGEVSTLSLTFVASDNLRRAILEASPGLSGLVQFQPPSINGVRRGEPVSVQVVFAPPVYSPVGTVTGTIRLRKVEGESGPKRKNDIFTPTLPVRLNLWTRLADHLGSFQYPPDWNASRREPTPDEKAGSVVLVAEGPGQSLFLLLPGGGQGYDLSENLVEDQESVEVDGFHGTRRDFAYPNGDRLSRIDMADVPGYPDLRIELEVHDPSTGPTLETILSTVKLPGR